jgi:serine/threonine protein kinase/formylglycine-generating enzyme required for sulfatase activity
MAGKDGHEEALTPAEAAFVEFLADQDSDHPLDFESFAAHHPALKAELARLHEEWLGIARVLRRGRDESPSIAGLSARPDQFVELRVDADEKALELEFAGELVRRLARGRIPAGRYESRGEIARGGMGVIYRIWDPHLRRQLAMKVILARREVATPEERSRAMRRALARFLEEAQITSQLDHPGVVPVHDLGIDDKGRVYFTMRLVRGRDFRHILELMKQGKEGWTLARALGVLLKVCEAVAYAHSKGVVHRDLKPPNVMVGRFGEVYVMDWGLARVLGRPDQHELRIATDDPDGEAASRVDTDVRRFAGQTPGSPLLTIDGRVVGTPSYMSPEQAGGRIEELGPRSDVYAIGAMLYHLLTGHMPYVPAGAEVTPANVYTMLLAGPPPPVKQLAPHAHDDLVAICEKAMAREPDDRYAGALEIAQEIEAFLDHRPLVARSPTVGYVARLFFERNRVLASTVAAAVIVVAVVVAIGWSKNAAKQRENARLLELRSAEVLASSIEELFPADPAHVGKMQRWLDGVDAVLAKAPGYRAELAAAQAAGDDATSELLAAPVRAMERLAGSLRPEVEKWRAQAADLVRVSLTVDAAKWREAIDDVAALAVYGGLEMKEQLGLVPLRVDPASGLWEFWHVLSGERPLPDPASPSGYRVTPAMGIVLVLLPGGTTTIGSPADEPDRDNTNEPLAHEVTLEPSFLAKFEVTQAQWLRVMGDRPSLYGPGARILAADRPSGAPPDDADVHPVESVNWETCSRFLRRVGLRLPGEDEWERGARAGTTTSYWWEAEAGQQQPARLREHRRRELQAPHVGRLRRLRRRLRRARAGRQLPPQPVRPLRHGRQRRRVVRRMVPQRRAARRRRAPPPGARRHLVRPADDDALVGAPVGQPAGAEPGARTAGGAQPRPLTPFRTRASARLRLTVRAWSGCR